MTARTLNPVAAPSDILAGTAPKWQARDDVYQVGQLLGMLIKGDARMRVRRAEIRHLTCSDHLKEIVHRCIGERRKRYESADHLIDALRNPPAALRAGGVRSLRGVHLFFTGILSKTRREAAAAADRAGAIVHSGPSAKTTVVVRGRPNALQAAGKDAGLKLMELKRLREPATASRLSRRRSSGGWSPQGADLRPVPGRISRYWVGALQAASIIFNDSTKMGCVTLGVSPPLVVAGEGRVSIPVEPLRVLGDTPWFDIAGCWFVASCSVPVTSTRCPTCWSSRTDVPDEMIL